MGPFYHFMRKYDIPLAILKPIVLGDFFVSLWGIFVFGVCVCFFFLVLIAKQL